MVRKLACKLDVSVIEQRYTVYKIDIMTCDLVVVERLHTFFLKTILVLNATII